MSAPPHHRRILFAALFAAGAILAACAGQKTSAFQRESFESNTTYSRSFTASAAQTCEAARRALLSQGYVVILANGELVNARKSFQTEGDSHVEIDFRVVCATERRSSGSTLAFVTALQDRYALKKSNSSASVGVGAIGSLSLPFIGSDDSLVKVASETITAATFYDRYFRLLTQYLDTSEPEPAVVSVTVPVPAAVVMLAPAAASAPASASASAAAPASAPAPASSTPTPTIPATAASAAQAPASAASSSPEVVK